MNYSSAFVLKQDVATLSALTIMDNFMVPHVNIALSQEKYNLPPASKIIIYIKTKTVALFSWVGELKTN